MQLCLESSKIEYAITQHPTVVDVRYLWERFGFPYVGGGDDSGDVRDDDGARASPLAVLQLHRTQNGFPYVIQNMICSPPHAPEWGILNACASYGNRPFGLLVLQQLFSAWEHSVPLPDQVLRVGGWGL